jgi:hypothetical protein
VVGGPQALHPELFEVELALDQAQVRSLIPARDRASVLVSERLGMVLGDASIPVGRRQRMRSVEVKR